MRPMEHIHTILSNSTTAGEFIILLLQNVASYPNTIESIQRNGGEILEVFGRIPGIQEIVMKHAVATVQGVCLREVEQLSEKKTGFHLGEY